MIPNIIFISYILIWAGAIKLNPFEPDYIIACAMVLPFVAVIFPVLLFGVGLPPGYLRLSMHNFKHAPLKFVLVGAVLNSAPIFYIVITEKFNLAELGMCIISIIIGSSLVVYAHKNKVKPRLVL